MSRTDGGGTTHARTTRQPSSRPVGSSTASAAARPARENRRRSVKWLIPLGVTACYVLFAVAVHLRLLDSFDLALRNAARPGGVWGPPQIRATRVAEALQPVHVAWALLLVAVVLCVLRSSLRPIAVAVTVGVPVAIVTRGTKWVMAHSDPATAPVAHDSFPSGHTVSVIVAFGLVVLLLRVPTRWGWMPPTLMGCLMGSALVLADIHPASDVIGGGLLALAGLASAQTAGLGQWASTRQARGIA